MSSRDKSCRTFANEIDPHPLLPRIMSVAEQQVDDEPREGLDRERAAQSDGDHVELVRVVVELVEVVLLEPVIVVVEPVRVALVRVVV